MVLSKSKIANFVLTAMNIREKGYRLNVGIIVANSDGKLLYCKRKKSNNWQFPQGGIDGNEFIEDAMYRELYEEVGLKKKDVSIVGKTNHEIRYDIPKTIRSRVLGGKFKGQLQTWYLLRLENKSSSINLAVSYTHLTLPTILLV